MPRKRRDNPEQRLQISTANYLRMALRPPVVWSAIGHGGGGAVRGAILKAMGVAPGMPDLIVFAPGGHAPYYPIVIAIELKAPKGSLSPEQRDMAVAFRSVGVSYYVARSVEDVAMILRREGVKLHAAFLGSQAEVLPVTEGRSAEGLAFGRTVSRGLVSKAK